MSDLVSVVIPNYNGSKTIGKCLEAVYASDYGNFEVIVVDDCSVDNSLEVIKGFPCQLIRLQRHAGAAKARNTGARQASGDILFFTDADCLLLRDTLSHAVEAVSSAGANVVAGGTYTPIPYDNRFFSRFQSVFINYSETRRPADPDYIATHALAIPAQGFRDQQGFAEEALPILEDVEFSHRLRRAGYRLRMQPAMQVQHIFGYTLYGSLRNAVRKSMYWTVYSIRNRDLLRDSGTASIELKVNVMAWFVSLWLIAAVMLAGHFTALVLVAALTLSNLFISRRLLRAFYRAAGPGFALAATLYYVLLYPLAVGLGAFAGALVQLGSGQRRTQPSEAQ